MGIQIRNLPNGDQGEALPEPKEDRFRITVEPAVRYEGGFWPVKEPREIPCFRVTVWDKEAQQHVCWRELTDAREDHQVHEIVAREIARWEPYYREYTF
jgi:hypothetical protein